MTSLLSRLTPYFDNTLTLDQLKDILDGETESEKILLQDLQLIKNVTNDAEIINILNDICSEWRIVKESEKHSQKNDSWEYLSTTVNIEQLLIFHRCLIELAFQKEINLINYRLAILSGRSYILLIATPGAKAFGIFQPDIIIRTFHLLHAINKLCNTHSLRNSNLLSGYLSLLEDIEILLKNVSFEEHEILKLDLLNELANLIEFNYVTGFRNTSITI